MVESLSSKHKAQLPTLGRKKTKITKRQNKCGVPFFFQFCWPPVHEDKGVEAATENFAWAVNMLEIAFEYTASVRQLSFNPEYREYVRLGTVAGESPNLH